MRKIRVFGKVVNENPAALTIYETQKAYEAEANKLEEELKENKIKLRNMEGKYAIGTERCDDLPMFVHANSYYYIYPSDEIRMKELEEMKEFQAIYCIPLRKRIDELWERIWELREELCIALWGYGEKRYRLEVNLREAEKELEEAIARVNALREELTGME